MSLIDDVHDALTSIPGLLQPQDCCHFTAASPEWRERLSYAMRDIEDQTDVIEELQKELAREERNAEFEEKRANTASDEAADLRAERNTLNVELGRALLEIKQLKSRLQITEGVSPS